MLYAGPKLENPAGVDAFDLGGGGGGPVIDGFQLEPVAVHYPPTTSTWPSGLGHSFSSVGTASNADRSGGDDPPRINYVTSASANAEARFGYEDVPAVPYVSVGSLPGFITRLSFVLADSDYGSGATGSRVWIHYSRTGSGWPADDMGSGTSNDGFGLRRSTSHGESTWVAISKNANQAATITDTGLSFTPGAYHVVFWNLPGTGVVNWSISKVGGGSASGTFTAPPNNAGQRIKIRASLTTLSAVARNIQFLGSSIALIRPGPAS